MAPAPFVSTRRQGHRSCARKIGLGSLVGRADPTEDREPLGQRKHADQIEVQSPDTKIAAQATQGRRVVGVVGPTQIEIAAFYGEIALELIAAIQLVAAAASIS